MARLIEERIRSGRCDADAVFIWTGGQGQGGPDEDASAKATRPPLTSWSALHSFVNQSVRLLHGWDWPSHEFQELEIPDDRN